MVLTLHVVFAGKARTNLKSNTNLKVSFSSYCRLQKKFLLCMKLLGRSLQAANSRYTIDPFEDPTHCLPLFYFAAASLLQIFLCNALADCYLLLLHEFCYTTENKRN